MEKMSFEKALVVVGKDVGRLVIKFLRAYFRTLDHIFGAAFTRKIDRVLSIFEGPEASVDERIAKIDVARDNLLEGLQAIDELKREAQENKRELAIAIQTIENLEQERSVAEKELRAIRGIADADTSMLRKVIGVPSQTQIWKERLFGFVSGVMASVVASFIWWLITR
jgi:hypothetical protein